MAATPHDSTGTTVTFPGFSGTITGITLNASDTGAVIDISHLGQTVGQTILTTKAPLKGTADGDTGLEVSVDFIGKGVIAGGSSGTLVIAGGAAVNAVATVQSSSVTLAVNDVIRGSVTFRVVN